MIDQTTGMPMFDPHTQQPLTDGGHAFNAVNVNGTVVWPDMQSNTVSVHPINTWPDPVNVWSIVLDWRQAGADPAVSFREWWSGVSGSEPVRWPAYATDCRFPIDQAEAMRLVRKHLHLPDGLPDGWNFSVDEWESSFTVTVTLPAPLDEPPEPGGGVVVLDKETGYFSFWPSWGTVYVVQRFDEAKAAGQIDYLADWPEPNVTWA